MKKRVLIYGLVAFVAGAVFFVPWQQAIPDQQGPVVVGPLGYAPVFSPPQMGASSFGRQPYARIDPIRLLLQLAAIAAVTGVAHAVVPKEREGDARKGDPSTDKPSKS
jgi:hypothetical protein